MKIENLLAIQTYFKDEEDAEDMMRQRRSRRGIVDDDMESVGETDTDEPINTSPNGYDEEDC